MSTHGSPPGAVAPPPGAFTGMLRAALVPSLVAGAACAVVALVTSGLAGLVAALVGVALVVLFFGSTLVVLGRTARTSPQLVMVVALGTYTAKVVLLAVAFVLLARLTDLPGPALGLTTIVVTTVWLGFELRGFLRARHPVVDEPRPGAGSGTGPGVDGGGSGR
ncbi:hypothetical protein [uncultured Pseudokineococcus sp.]|uniref:hypothetical protein n=1 Tax=uncultured Pseudokineococcus sp. TaxID=1642928 RepID=UPI00261D41D4|nr:hypothetical protein [uncultured Pseudokineococcus sp.]